MALLNTFIDKAYNRTGFTITSSSSEALQQAVVRVSQAAIERVDLRSHVATHPRLGVADHISVHPLSWKQAGDHPAEASASSSSSSPALAAAASCARSIGRQLSSLCPVYFYGAADPKQRRLADIRRSLGEP